MSTRFSILVFYIVALLLLAAQPSLAANKSSLLNAFTENAEDKFLHPDEAFKLDVVATDHYMIEH